MSRSGSEFLWSWVISRSWEVATDDRRVAVMVDCTLVLRAARG